MKATIKIACLYTLISAVLLGVVYPLLITGVAQVMFRNKANGQLIVRRGTILGSEILGQPFTGSRYFHSRPSAAGTGYDATSSSGSNLAPTSKALLGRVDTDVRKESTGTPVPVDLVTASASGLDPDLTPAAALYQVPRVARERGLAEDSVRTVVLSHEKQRQLGLLGEPYVNVLELNLALDELKGQKNH